MKQYIHTLREFCTTHTFATWVACGYLFFSHVPRTTAVVNTLSAFMLITTLVLAFRGRLTIDWRSNLVRAFAAFVLVVIAGITLSPYWRESLIPFRRELVPMLLAFVLLTGQRTVQEQHQQRRVALLAAWALISAFVIRSFLALRDWLAQGVQTDYYSSDHATARFFDFFAIDASLIMPVVVAACLYLVMSRGTRALLVLSLVIAMLLIVVSSVRTALIVMVLVTLLQLLPRLRSRKVWALLGVAVISLLVVMSGTNRLQKVTERYATVFTKEAYQGSEATGASSIYERLSIWKGTLEMAAERPLVGYGLGWQKLYDAAYEGGYVARWRASPAFIDRTVAHYFDVYERGKVNPHNLWVDIVFETGALGLLSYTAMLLVLLVRAIRALKQRATDDVVTHWFGAACLAYLLAYLLVNMMGGFWLASGATLMLMIVSELVRQQQGASTRSSH
jgi:O-antigen ligase